jgi:glutamine---fructose-6-phosphate transaminase (isomerizing)
MCGIFGHVGSKDSVRLCIEGLRRLEYRGYDSSGIAGVCKGDLYAHKEIGKIAALEDILRDQPLSLELAIAHTRWATHGVPSKENAHPLFDENHSLAVIHNGIIQNHYSLRAMLIEKGFTFSSDTDTEVIAQLVAYFYKGDFLKALHEALSLMEGTWGLAFVHKEHPQTLFVAAYENPLAIARDPKERQAFISSDANAFQGEHLELLFLQKGDIAAVTADQVSIYDHKLSPVIRSTQTFSFQNRLLSKNGFEHFMSKEIFEQPYTIQQALTFHPDELSLTREELLAFKNVLILACGTSWHAGSIGALFLEEIGKVSARAEIASEFRYKESVLSKETLVIAISQSGETLDTIVAVRRAKSAGAKVIALCNVPHSTLTREADATLFLKAGPEMSVCSTKAFTSQLSLLALVTFFLARLRGQITEEEHEGHLDALRKVPHQVHQVLNQNESIRKMAQKYAHFKQFLFLGRQYMYVAAQEAALKLTELSYLQAVAYPAGELKHGPIALLDTSLPVICLLGNERTYEKALSNLMEVKARRSPLLALAPQGAHQISEIADDLLWLPPTSDLFAAFPYSVACQLLAYYIARERGTDIDQPRHLAKSVTVE